jgi:hypothetical protein
LEKVGWSEKGILGGAEIGFCTLDPMACTVAMAFHVGGRTKSLDRTEYRNPFGPSRIFVLPYLGII